MESIDAKLNAFKKLMDELNLAFISQFLNSVGFKPQEEYKERPQEMTAKQAAQLMVGKKKITILTGAGISAPSGIPTFRGNDGIWYT